MMLQRQTGPRQILPRQILPPQAMRRPLGMGTAPQVYTDGAGNPIVLLTSMDQVCHPNAGQGTCIYVGGGAFQYVNPNVSMNQTIQSTSSYQNTANGEFAAYGYTPGSALQAPGGWIPSESDVDSWLDAGRFGSIYSGSSLIPASVAQAVVRWNARNPGKAYTLPAPYSNLNAAPLRANQYPQNALNTNPPLDSTLATYKAPIPEPLTPDPTLMPGLMPGSVPFTPYRQSPIMAPQSAPTQQQILASQTPAAPQGSIAPAPASTNATSFFSNLIPQSSPSTTPGPTASSDLMLGSFDVTQNWMLLAAGAAALFFLMKK